MYVYKLGMIKARIKWCISLWFCFLLHSILNLDHAPKTILYLAILDYVLDIWDSVPKYIIKLLFPPPFYFVFYISNLLSYIQNNFKLWTRSPHNGNHFSSIL